MKRVFEKLRKKSDQSDHPPATPRQTTEEEPQVQQSRADRRVSRRHPANVPAAMAYGFAGMPEPSQVKDINERGLFLYSVLPLARGSTIEVELTLPPELEQPGKRRVRYSATVLRVEEKRESELFGIAAAIKSCRVLPDHAEQQEADTEKTKSAKNSG